MMSQIILLHLIQVITLITLITVTIIKIIIACLILFTSCAFMLTAFINKEERCISHISSRQAFF